MKRTDHFLTNIFCVLLILLNTNTFGQGNWAAFSERIETKKAYEGQRFRLHGMVRAEVMDDSASAQLWVRIDKEKGTGFFENMSNRPVRTSEWRSYSIEGKIDSGSTHIAFGVLSTYNGKFYYDDLKLDIETQKGKWSNVFTAGFEDGKNILKTGVGEGKAGIDSNYNATIVSGQKAGGVHCLLIEATSAPNYGINNKVGKYADVNGIKLYYEIYGQGPPLVVLHGNGGSIGNATTFYPELIKKYKVIAIDSRAQGRSGDTDKPLTYDQMAADVNSLLEQLKIDSVFIWGQSDGAILGLLLAKDYPKKVKRVVAFGSNIQPDSLALFQWAIAYSEKIIKESADPKEKKLNQLMLDYPKMPYSDLSQIKAPVLVVAGDRDVIRPEHTLKIFQNIPNSQMCIIPGATHGAAWEKKELFLMIVDEFFNKPFKMPDTKEWFQ